MGVWAGLRGVGRVYVVRWREKIVQWGGVSGVRGGGVGVGGRVPKEPLAPVLNRLWVGGP